MVHPLMIDFQELYRRHLCRHSQFGLNVLHLVAVVGIYLSLYRIVFSLPGSIWILGAGLSIYLGILMAKLPFRLWLINTVVVLLLLSLAAAAPAFPIWGYVLLIFFLHWFQNWSHRLYTKSYDMTAYKKKYPKGVPLFLTLSLFELPILLNYLAFDRRSWVS